MSTDTATDLSILEQLDFEPTEPLCDFGTVAQLRPVCDGKPALVVGALPCPSCGDECEGVALACASCWGSTESCDCTECGHRVARDQGFHIVRRLA